MLEFLDSMSFVQLSWMAVVVYLLHYMEEGPRLVEWFKNHYPIRGFNYTQKKLNLENLILFGMQLIMIVLFNIYSDNWILQGLVLGIAIGFIANTFFHVIPTLRTGIYSPGVVTASMLNPVMFMSFFWKAGQEGILTVLTVLIAVVSGLIVLPLVVILTHKVILRENPEGEVRKEES